MKNNNARKKYIFFNSHFSTFNSQNGQVLLIVVLIMMVTLAVGLAVVSRSITNLRTATEEANSQRAFSAAEAGIEQGLNSGRTGVVIGANGSVPLDAANPRIAAIQNVTVSEVKGRDILLKGGSVLGRDDGADLWISSYVDNPGQLIPDPRNITLTIYWCEQSDGLCNNKAAVEIISVSGSRINPVTTRYAFDPDADRGNNFTPATPATETVSGVAFRYKTSPITITNGMFVRIIPLYANAKIGVKSSVDLPIQGRLVDATGIAGETVRKVNYFQGHPEFPPELFYILFQTEPSQS